MTDDRAGMEPGSSIEPEIVKPIQPYQAVKEYVCPGCAGTIEAGIGHLVVIPEETPDLRRHWHRGCWFKERRRRGLTPEGSTAR